MSDAAIAINGLGKRYRLGQLHTGLLSHRLDRAISRLLRMGRGRSDRRRGEPIWALRDVGFEVPRGQVLGIIGRNGAGKSTLLKILSRITEPTEGRVELRGRVASLLEVGTGFHPELTGRENIFLNGAILGMSRREINRKFDQIVAFAEVERFIDTPVKRYSSGMHVRLAFAVAAHLEPEILLIDEVLAVGDAGFQRKCLGRMNEVAGQGRTVLFVSHNMAAVTNLCHRAAFLDGGRLRDIGPVEQVVGRYMAAVQGADGAVSLESRTDRDGDGRLRFVGFEIRTASRGPTDTLCGGEPVHLLARYRTRDGRPMRNVSVSFAVYDQLGRHLFMCWTRLVGCDYDEISGEGTFAARLDGLPLPEGRYSVNLWCEAGGMMADWIQEAAAFTVVQGDFFGTGRATPNGHGGVLVRHTWEQAA